MDGLLEGWESFRKVGSPNLLAPLPGGFPQQVEASTLGGMRVVLYMLMETT